MKVVAQRAMKSLASVHGRADHFLMNAIPEQTYRWAEREVNRYPEAHDCAARNRGRVLHDRVPHGLG